MTLVGYAKLNSQEDFKKYEKMVKNSRAYHEIPTLRKDGLEGKSSKEFIYLRFHIESDKELVEYILSKVNPETSTLKFISIGSSLSGISIPDSWSGRVFLDLSQSNISLQELRALPLENEGVVTLVNSAAFSDLRAMVSYASSRGGSSAVRFIGGELLAVDGLGVGFVDSGLAKEFGLSGKEEPQVLFSPVEDISATVYNGYDFFRDLQLGYLLGKSGLDIIWDSSVKSKPKTKTIKVKVPKVKSSEPKVKKEKVVKEGKLPKPSKKDKLRSLIQGKVEF